MLVTFRHLFAETDIFGFWKDVVLVVEQLRLFVRITRALAGMDHANVEVVTSPLSFDIKVITPHPYIGCILGFRTGDTKCRSRTIGTSFGLPTAPTPLLYSEWQ